MSDLLDRLQSATEGSRELDGRVYCAARGLEFHMWDGAGIVVRRPKFRHIESERVKYYTTNLQDAVSLVPPGLDGHGTFVQIEIYADGTGNCGIHPWWKRSRDDEIWSRVQATPALAVCTAIIKFHEIKDRPVKIPEIRRIAEADDGALEGDL